MLKITTPFTEKKEVIPFIESGADELYCGYLSPEWREKYTSLEFERKGGGSNFTDLKELGQAVELAHKNKVPVYLALNGLYVNRQYPLLLKIIEQLDKIDIDGYIISDIGLLLTLRKQGFKKDIHISCCGTAFNSEAVRFYKELGASRVILDRQVTIGSMEDLCADNPDVDFEVFILNTLCVYIDGFCTFLHTYSVEYLEDIVKEKQAKYTKLYLTTVYDPKAQGDACGLKYSVRAYTNVRTGVMIPAKKVRPVFYKHLIDGIECGACALYDIGKTGVKSVKIVGRQLNPEARLKSLVFIRRALSRLENNPDIDKAEFISSTKRLYKETFKSKNDCMGNNCYYPYVCVK